MIKKLIKFDVLVASIISILLINPLSVTANAKKTGQVSLPEYQQTTQTNNNISDEEKEKLLKKYFNKTSSSEKESTDFEKAKAQLKKDGYNIVQDGYNKDAWIVSKKINGKTTCLTVYPFDEKGNTTINVKDIEKTFNTYKKLIKAGYKVNCSGKTNLYYYFSLGKGQAYTQITTNEWTISKGKTKIKMSYIDDNGKSLSLSKVNEAFKFETAKAQLKKDGYNFVQDGYNKDAWIVSKKINGKTTCLTVYPFDEKGNTTINVKDIEKTFNTYKKLIKAGYKVNCSGKTNLYYYFSLGKGQAYTQITTNEWTISKGKTKIKMPYIDDNGKTLSLSKVNETFKFETAKAQLKKDGYNFVQDGYNKDAWIVSKKINGQTTCLTVYPFNEKGKATIDTKNIEGLFKLYKDLKKSGYSIDCKGKTSLYYYFSLGKGQAYTQITADKWVVSKGNKKTTVYPFDNKGKVKNINNIFI